MSPTGAMGGEEWCNCTSHTWQSGCTAAHAKGFSASTSTAVQTKTVSFTLSDETWHRPIRKGSAASNQDRPALDRRRPADDPATVCRKTAGAQNTNHDNERSDATRLNL